jgi:hypothetical protein
MKKLILFGCLFAATVLLIGLYSYADTKTGTISGQIMPGTEIPTSGWVAYFFNSETGPPPDLYKYRRIPDQFVPVGDDGRFTMELAEGTYYIAVVKRLSSGRIVGPPDPGDYFISPRDNNGIPNSYVVKPGENTDIGVISGVETFKGLSNEGVSGIEGAVLDSEGNPVNGVAVLAFRTKTDIQRPLFVSDLTGSDGKYFIRVGEGTYYLKVRAGYGGGAPVEGEIIGDYGENKPDAVTVEKGQVIKGINIKVVNFPGRGPEKGDINNKNNSRNNIENSIIDNKNMMP